MPREEARLALIQSLSQGLLRELAPEGQTEFDRDFSLWLANPARWAIREPQGGQNLVLPLRDRTARGPQESGPANPPRGLDTTLVAGMFLQVILEAEHLPGNTLERTSYVKQAVKNFLVQRLAGQITLSQFFRLVQIIEHEVTYYFHRLQGEWLAAGEVKALAPAAGPEAGLTPPRPPALAHSDLRQALSRLPLPHQANRKLSPEGLFDFLARSEGRWFRLLDFESHFRLNKKTAWTYLALLLHHGILRHNEAKANKVRYSLSLDFMAPEPASQR